jgi:hypothetical protein
MKINNWALVQNPFSMYEAPELVKIKLSGTVTGHPSIDDGKWITTARIKEITLQEDRLVCRTASGSEYELGEVDPEYEAAFPNAAARLSSLVNHG